MNYFKIVMIGKIKMRIKGKVFGKMCVKNYQRFLFSKYVVCNQDRNGVRHEGKSWCLFLKKISNALTGIYVFQKFAFYLKYITLPKQPSSTLLPTSLFLGENVPSPTVLRINKTAILISFVTWWRSSYLFHIFVTTNRDSNKKNI